MVIECPKCRTKFRFDENKIVKDGVWVRCSRCLHVFLKEKPAPEDDMTVSSHSVETRDLVRNGAVFVPQEKTEAFEGSAARELAEAANEDDSDREELPPVTQRARRNLWTPGKIIAYIVILLLVMGGVYLSIFPDIGKHLLGKTPLAQFFGIKVSAAIDGGGIDLLNVRERFIENRMIGSIMVIQGFAVNKNSYSVSKIKVKAKLLDASGEFIGESDAYCGNILAEEDLVNLTEREVRQELNNPLGKNTPNSNIPKDGNIPFMIVFINSPPKATEYIVELAELEKPLR